LLKVLRASFVITVVLSAAALVGPVFDVNLPRGLDFILQNSPTPQKYLIETMPGGVALLDYNNDGLLDIFLVNGGHISTPMQTPENFDRHDPRYWNRLYRQNKDGSFTDVTEQAGLANAGDGNYGMGVAVGDQLRKECSLSQQRRRHLHRRNRKGRSSRRRMVSVSRVFRL
jgi:hypothetical protein